MPVYKCPICGCSELLVGVQVEQTWLVDGKSRTVLDKIAPHRNILRSPGDEDVIKCAACNYTAPAYFFDDGNQFFGHKDHEVEHGKKVYTRIVSVSSETYADIVRAIGSPGHMGEDDTISVTAKFPDGFEMDVKCCGSQDVAAWTEAVLFHNGSECGCTEVCDEFLGDWELETEDAKYVAKVVVERYFDFETVKHEFNRGTIKLKPSPNGDGIVCAIGNNWFYFSGADAEEYQSVVPYQRNVDKSVIVRSIAETLDELRLSMETMDEYAYYVSYVKEHQPKPPEDDPDGEGDGTKEN